MRWDTTPQTAIGCFGDDATLCFESQGLGAYQALFLWAAVGTVLGTAGSGHGLGHQGFGQLHVLGASHSDAGFELFAEGEEFSDFCDDAVLLFGRGTGTAKRSSFSPVKCLIVVLVNGWPTHNPEMNPLLAAALDEATHLIESRGWARPTPSTLAEAERLLDLTTRHRPPSIQIDADGSVRLEWEAAETGWLTLTVDGSGQVRHSAVIGEDEFERIEVFGDALPQWAATVLERLLQVGH